MLLSLSLGLALGCGLIVGIATGELLCQLTYNRVCQWYNNRLLEKEIPVKLLTAGGNSTPTGMRSQRYTVEFM